MADDCKPLMELPAVGLCLKDLVHDIERDLILQALNRTGWNRTKAAKLLSMNLRRIRYKIHTLGISKPRRGWTDLPEVAQETTRQG